MVESFKSVSEPYWTDDKCRINYEMSNPSSEYYVDDYRYHYYGDVCWDDDDTRVGSYYGKKMCYDDFTGKYWDIDKSFIQTQMEVHGNKVRVKLIKYDYKLGTYTPIDEVTRTIPAKPVESWKSVDVPYWSGMWVRIDYEMQNPDLTPYLPPTYPYRYFYRGEPWISGVCEATTGGQMQPGSLTGYVLFAGNPGDTVTLKLAKIDRDDVSVVHSYPDEVTRTIPDKPICTCTSWQDAGCISITQRKYIRTCTPAGCDIEEKIVDDPSCYYEPPCTPDTHEVLEYCLDGITEKRWRDCISGVWIYNEQKCPEEPSILDQILPTLIIAAILAVIIILIKTLYKKK